MEEENTSETFETLISQAEPLFDTKVHSLMDKVGTTPGAVEQIIEASDSHFTKMPTLARQASIPISWHRNWVFRQCLFRLE